jgi:7-carboxy-7-deazaguanine synthase
MGSRIPSPEMLFVSEIFHSLQGESSYVGYPCVFIRLSGCNLRCAYCDTRQAYEGGTEMSIGQILDRVLSRQCGLVEITGGEPLLQDETPALAASLLQKGSAVLVETNGTQDIGLLPGGVIRIMDIKCPGSGESGKTDWNNIRNLRNTDEIKFVISHKDDFDWAKNVIQKHGLDVKASILFSPVHGKLNPAELANWILEDRLRVRFQLQLHKILWPGWERGR